MAEAKPVIVVVAGDRLPNARSVKVALYAHRVKTRKCVLETACESALPYKLLAGAGVCGHVHVAIELN